MGRLPNGSRAIACSPALLFSIGVLLIGGKLIGEKENKIPTYRTDFSYNWMAGECFRKVKCLTPRQRKRSLLAHMPSTRKPIQNKLLPFFSKIKAIALVPIHSVLLVR